MMPDTTTITVRITTAIRAKLDRLATLTDRSRSYLAAEAVEFYVDNELDIIDGMLEGSADFDAGRYYTTDEVIAATDKIIERNAKRRKTAAPAKSPRKAA